MDWKSLNGYHIGLTSKNTNKKNTNKNKNNVPELPSQQFERSESIHAQTTSWDT